MTKVTRLTLDQSGGLERRRLHLREISDEADMPLETVGQDLRTARQRKGEDIATVSKALKIRKDHLEAIEESNFEGLPGRAYAIGFVRTYSDYLGLDGPACVERFKAEIAGRDSTENEMMRLSVPEERKLPQGSIVFVVLLLIATVYGGYYLSVTADRMLTEPVTPVPERLTAQATPPVAPAPVTVVTTTTTEATTPATAEPTAPAAAAPAGDQVAVSTPPPAANALAPTPEETAALPKGREIGAQNVGSRIILRVHKPTRVLVQGPGNAVFLNRTLLAGDIYHAPNLVGLSLTTPDGGAIEVILDGAPMGYVGKQGIISEGLSLNPQAIVDRFNDSHAQSG